MVGPDDAFAESVVVEGEWISQKEGVLCRNHRPPASSSGRREGSVVGIQRPEHHRRLLLRQKYLQKLLATTEFP